jgi:flavorubredoxin
MKAAVVYWSKTGNTEKVAEVVRESLESRELEVDYLRAENAMDLDYYEYDLICLGFPSYSWHPPKPVDEFLTEHHRRYRKLGRIKVGSPRLAGKFAVVFCTYAGPHTGIDEATPAGKYAGQFFDHLGFTVLDELYVVGQAQSEEANTKGRLGDIRGRPNRDDLEEVRQRMEELLKGL